jgi:hypothetical protein
VIGYGRGMDAYFIVAELELSPEAMEAWLYGEPSTVGILEEAEGDVTVVVTGNRCALRTFLVDAAYFQVSHSLAAAFARAEALGGTGRWYSGDQVSGTLGTLGGAPAKVKVQDLPADVAEWVREAGELGESGDEMRASQATVRKKPGRKKPATKKPAKKKPAKKKPAKRVAKKAAKKAPKKKATKKAIEKAAKKAPRKPGKKAPGKTAKTTRRR